MKLLFFLLSLIVAAVLANVNCVYGLIGVSHQAVRQSPLIQPAFRIKTHDSSSSLLLAHGAEIIVQNNKRNDSMSRSLNAAISLFFAFGIVPSAFAVSGGGLDYANLGS
jgi:hypothetical protein